MFLFWVVLIESGDTQSSSRRYLHSEDSITFSEVDIVTPAQKLLARQLKCDILPGKSLLVTGLFSATFVLLYIKSMHTLVYMYFMQKNNI